MRKIFTLGWCIAIGLSSAFAADPPSQRMVMPQLNEATSNPALPFLPGNPFVGSLPASQHMQRNGFFSNSGSATAAVFKNGNKKLSSPLSKISPSGASVYGHLMFEDTKSVDYWAEVFLDGTKNQIASMNPTFGNRPITTKLEYVRGNVYYAYGYGQEYSPIGDGAYHTIIYTYDLTTNQASQTNTPAGNGNPILNYQLGAYDADNDIVYGYTYDGKDVYFGYAPGNDPSKFTQTGIVDVSTVPNGTWKYVAYTFNPETQQFITFWEDGTVTSSDLTNGDFSVIANLTVPSAYTTGACYSPYDKGYIFAVCNPSEDHVADCSIQLLDPRTFGIISQVDYEYPIEYKMLACADSRRILDSAPGQASLLKINFPKGALMGSLTYKLASSTVADVPVMGNIDWILYVDGKEVKRGSAPAGSEVTVPVEALEEGMHAFKFRQGLGGNYGPDLLNENIYIGNDTPMAPESVTLTEKYVTWTPVSTGIHGAYINADEVTYNVYLNDELIESGVSGTTCSTHLGAGVQLNLFTASVEAVFDRKVSDKTYSNDISFGEPVSIPYSVLPTEKETSLFTIYNPDGNDGIYFYAGNHAAYGPDLSAFYYFGGYADNGGAYLFLPPVNFPDANAVYEFTAEIFRNNRNYEESYEVILATGTTPDTKVKTIIGEKSCFLLEDGADHAPILQRTNFTVPKPGVYYIAIHGTSKKGERVWMTKFNIDKSEGLTPASPDLVTNLDAVPGQQGALEASVTFNLPLANAGGTPYADTKTLTASVQADGCEAVTVSGTPGQALTAVIPTKQGVNSITVTPYEGETDGIRSNISVYTGVYVPNVPVNLKAEMSADNYTATLSWEPPRTSITPGGYVAPTGIKYYLCQKQGNNWIPTDLIGTDVLTCDIRIPEDTPQSLAQFGIIAENVAGMSDKLTTCQTVVGKLQEIPSENNFYQGQSVQPIVNYSDMSFPFLGDPKTYFPAFATPDNMTAFFTFAFANVTNAEFTLPRFSPTGAGHAAIELYVYGGSCESFSVCASAHGLPIPKVIATYPTSGFDTPGPQKIRVEFPSEFQDKGWIEPSIRYNAAAMSQSFILYGFRYIDNLADDFGISRIAGNQTARVGEEAKFTAAVVNYGYEDNKFPGAKWELADEEGEILASVEIPATAEAVPADATLTHEISFTPTVEQMGKLTLTYTIEPGDSKASNDTFSMTVPVSVGTQPVVTDLYADEISYDKVSLGWSEPVGADTSESFENEEPFILDGDSNVVGPFTRRDIDGKMTLTVNGLSGQPFAGIPASFVVYSQQEVENIMGESVFKANTGDKFLVAFCPGTADAVQPAADDWLISPEITGNTYVSFYAKPLTYQYGTETIEILYSTGSVRPSNFKLLSTIEIKGNASENPLYQEYSAMLPADAKYFAIRYTSQNKSAIFVDDIRFTPAENKADIKLYEIYRDGQMVGTTSDNATVYVDSDVQENSTYEYMVLPLLNDGGKGLNSNILRIRTTGIGGVSDGTKAIYSRKGQIIVKGYKDTSVNITSIGGVNVADITKASADEKFEVEPGVYIVKAGTSVVKLIVR